MTPSPELCMHRAHRGYTDVHATKTPNFILIDKIFFKENPDLVEEQKKRVQMRKQA